MTKTRSLYQYIALVMAFLMLFTTSGLSVDLHYCQGHLKSLSFIGKAKSCFQLTDADSNEECMVRHAEKAIQITDGCSLTQKDCCQNKLLQLISDKDKEVQSNQPVISQQLQTFVVAFVSVFLSTSSVDPDVANISSYKPPLIPRDIYVLLETFLL